MSDTPDCKDPRMYSWEDYKKEFVAPAKKPDKEEANPPMEEAKVLVKQTLSILSDALAR